MARHSTTSLIGLINLIAHMQNVSVEGISVKYHKFYFVHLNYL
jgi:hypothetical protein